jgi:sulfite reductase (NADPH) flavoprotein alpha-component
MQTEDKILLFQDLIKKSSREEISWFHGYCSALLAGHTKTEPSANGSLPDIKPTILYGTESGNSKKVALSLQSFLKKKQVHAKIFDASQYPLQKFGKEEYLFLIISTQGEGEPPASALKFYNFLHVEEDSLENLKYTVLALGDTSYPLFCKAGEDIDERLAKRKATRILEIRKCDTDFEETANEWIQDLTEALSQAKDSVKPSSNGAVKEKTGNKILTGTILEHVNLNDNLSDKETYHIAVEIEEGVSYYPGDVAGIYPENPAEVVEKILQLSGAEANKELTLAKKTGTIREHLTRTLNLSYLSVETIRKYAALAGQEIPEVRMDLQDLLRIYPLKNLADFESVLQILNPVSPRLYSIASSPSAHEGEIHLTVARSLFYTAENTKKFGVCSDFLAQKTVGSTLPLFIRKNAHFRLPNEDKDIVMIGPGTGIAPFRSFVAERDATGATGRNWLFFGDRKFTENFLYQTEWQQFQSTGVLTRINLAWSRDGKEKNYVQHELAKEAEELVSWIDGGAYLYICGTKDPMSRDVEETLISILSKHKNWTEQESAQFLEDLTAQGRYQKDVY